MEEEPEDASEDELAACGLMVELTRSSCLLTVVGEPLLALPSCQRGEIPLRLPHCSPPSGPGRTGGVFS